MQCSDIGITRFILIVHFSWGKVTKCKVWAIGHCRSRDCIHCRRLVCKDHNLILNALLFWLLHAVPCDFTHSVLSSFTSLAQTWPWHSHIETYRTCFTPSTTHNFTSIHIGTLLRSLMHARARARQTRHRFGVDISRYLGAEDDLFTASPVTTFFTDQPTIPTNSQSLSGRKSRPLLSAISENATSFHRALVIQVLTSDETALIFITVNIHARYRIYTSHGRPTFESQQVLVSL